MNNSGYYPIIKKTVATLGGKLTKTTFAKSVSKGIPVVGGVLSGVMTLATLKPMGMRLQRTLHEGTFEIIETVIVYDQKPIIEQSPVEKLKEAKELLDLGILNEEEFFSIKNKYMADL